MDQHWEMLGVWAGAFATLLSGMATLGAVIFALSLQRKLERHKIPTLRVEHDSASSSDNKYLQPSSIEMGGPGPDRHEVWVRIRVTNESRYPANDVEIRFISSQISSDHHRNNRPSWWFKVSNLNSVAVTIPPGFTQYFDAAYLIQEVSKPELRAFLVITRPEMLTWNEEKARIESYGDYTKLDIGWPYNIYFAVVGSNCTAAYYRVSLQTSPPRKSGGDIRGCITLGEPITISSDEAFTDSRQ